jgi:hypothetical protein
VNEATKEAGIMEQTGLIHLSFKSKHKYTHTLGKQLHFMTMSHISMISRVATPYHPWRTIAMPFLPMSPQATFQGPPFVALRFHGKQTITPLGSSFSRLSWHSATSSSEIRLAMCGLMNLFFSRCKSISKSIWKQQHEMKV